MATLFTSDTHFGHANIIKYCSRPFKSSYEMDEVLVENWNTAVESEDVVYHLGDFAFGRGITTQYASDIAKGLNGTIHLINGNHEKLAWSIPWRFETMQDYVEVEVQGQKIVLFHYGMRTWHHDLRGTWHLYGHSHGKLPAYGKSVDIGVDCWDFAPVKFAKLKEYMDKRPVGKHPTFDNFVVENA